MRDLRPADLVVTAAWCVTPLGSGPAALYRGWLDGRCALGPVRRFPTEALRARVGGEMPDPAGPWPGGMRGAAHLRECVTEAAARAGLGPGTRAAVIVATTKGFLDAGDRVGERHPAHDVSLPASHVADTLRTRFGWRIGGPDGSAEPVIVSMACASGTSALALAAARSRDLVAAGADAIVVAGIDLLSDFVFRGFAALAAVDPRPCRPFDVARAGLSPAEAAAALVLEPAAAAQRRGARPLGAILGWGLANDAAHPTAPARDGSGMIRAIRDALRRAGAEPADLGHVHAHGTGTAFNDAMEVQALREILGDAAWRVPVSTTKGTIGHAFGAAGLVEAIASIEAARHGVLPAIRGLSDPEPGLRFVRRAEPLGSPAFLRMSAGFGGFDAALVMTGIPDGAISGVPAPARSRSAGRECGPPHDPAQPCATGEAGRLRSCAAIVRCRVLGGVVRMRRGHGRWLRAGSVSGALTALTAPQRERAARLDATSRAAVAAVAAVLRTAGAGDRTDAIRWQASADDGCVAADLAFWETARASGGEFASPQRFAATLPSAVAGDVALVLGLRGECVITAGSARRGGGRWWTDDAGDPDAGPLLAFRVQRPAAGGTPRVTAELRTTSPPGRALSGGPARGRGDSLSRVKRRPDVVRFPREAGVSGAAR